MNTAQWLVSQQELDVNGHVNNTRYLDPVERLADALNNTRLPKEMTICYLAEAHAGDTLTLQYTLSEEGIFTLDGTRPRAETPEKPERIFAVKLCF